MYLCEMHSQIQNGKNKVYSLTDEKSFDLDRVGMDLVPPG
jgi:hypothetical protein